MNDFISTEYFDLQSTKLFFNKRLAFDWLTYYANFVMKSSMWNVS